MMMMMMVMMMMKIEVKIKMKMMIMIMKIIMMMTKTLSLRDDAVGAYCSGDLKLIWDYLGILVPREIARGHIQSCLGGIIISV